jgi:hypothetical protein
MSDKTCRTCGKGVRYIVTCSDREHQHAGLHQPDDTCRDYVERTDSVEQIARDIVQNFCDYWCCTIIDAKDNPCEGDECVMRRFIDRLRAQGIEVPE